MFRRRPLARAAVVGGVAYTASKAGARSAQNEAAEQQAPPPEAAPAPGVERLDRRLDEQAQGAGRSAHARHPHGRRVRGAEGKNPAGNVRSEMAIGPVQMLVLGFEDPNFTGEIIAELQRLKEQDIVRLIDAMAVQKDANGDITALQISDLSPEEAQEFGAIVGALIGLGEGRRRGSRGGSDRGRRGARGRPRLRRGRGLVRRGHDPERHRRGDRADRAPLGHPAARHDRPRGRLPARRRVDPPDGSRRRGRHGRGRGGGPQGVTKRGWRTGLEPATTGTTTRSSTN